MRVAQRQPWVRDIDLFRPHEEADAPRLSPQGLVVAAFPALAVAVAPRLRGSADFPPCLLIRRVGSAPPLNLDR